ncbi:guanylate kinase [candidate division WOR-3 bacterium]|uniref:Guanylate kinase n=1 Tax=candidate division WOR-3 bacterium TaxID=2052148 RepID=A0A9D5QCU4_UNCW3|nr:guanylate kinase [candidate division WOR-3 bacterium]MBD3364934.1 guanylate kinase [candidate division WOR-3 bacterium]
MLSRRPFLYIVSAPSGTGKTTLCRNLISQDSGLRYSVSVTTRPRKDKEENGKDYFFLTEAEFTKMVAAEELLEHEKVYGYSYGTPKDRVEELLKQGFDVLFDLDVKGALNLMRIYTDSVTVFLLPPSIKELRRRLFSRKRDDEETIEARLAAAISEINSASRFDYIVVNEELTESLRQLKEILHAERARSNRLEITKFKE